MMNDAQLPKLHALGINVYFVSATVHIFHTDIIPNLFDCE